RSSTQSVTTHFQFILTYNSKSDLFETSVVFFEYHFFEQMCHVIRWITKSYFVEFQHVELQLQNYLHIQTLKVPKNHVLVQFQYPSTQPCQTRKKNEISEKFE